MRRLLAVVMLLVAGCIRAEVSAPSLSTPRYRVTEVARGLVVPWSIAFAPDGRIFVTERPGRLRVITNGKLVAEPLFTFPQVSSGSEEGLMGLALHPDFAKNHLLYVSYATGRGDDMTVEVMRYRETGTTLVEPKAIVTGIPATHLHAGCRLKFGPDRKLYITTGDATHGEIAQRLTNLGGKILRVNDDGSIPTDNPWPKSPVWTLGHRNAQGIAWDPLSGLLFETEHGPSGFDGPGGGDEVNIIERGRNYGWPLVHHTESKAGFVSPLRVYTPALAPASAAFWRGDFWFGCLRGEQLRHLVIDPKERRHVTSEESLFTNLGRIRDVEAAPDGSLYVATSNRDGRGRAAAGDDRIFRIVAVE